MLSYSKVVSSSAVQRPLRGGLDAESAGLFSRKKNKNKNMKPGFNIVTSVNIYLEQGPVPKGLYTCRYEGGASLAALDPLPPPQPRPPRLSSFFTGIIAYISSPGWIVSFFLFYLIFFIRDGKLRLRAGPCNSASDDRPRNDPF